MGGASAHKQRQRNMAQYKHGEYLAETDDPAFDALLKPGEATPHSGIFRCEGCGREVVSEYWERMPPQNHHQHSDPQVPVQWRLIVRTG